MLRLLLVSALLTACASVPPYVPPTAVPYASDPKERHGWRSPRMCFNQCSKPLMRISVTF
jgi:hypothetical protein